jgi:DNA polymerase
MPEAMSARDFVPERLTLPALREAAASCRGCELYKRATQTVFGAGPRNARIMLVGEVPGDREDREGKPFVGPAGRLLDDALREASLDRDDAYVTNAVKHFSWEERGKRRLHKKPRWREVQACKPWLEAEIAVVEPQVIVGLGATAAQSLMGSKFRITQARGQLLECPWARFFMATYHPSAILRAPEKVDAERMQREFIDDLRKAAAAIDGSRQHG